PDLSRDRAGLPEVARRFRHRSRQGCADIRRDRRAARLPCADRPHRGPDPRAHALPHSMGGQRARGRAAAAVRLARRARGRQALGQPDVGHRRWLGASALSDLEQRLAEDKALRDAALALFKADLALVRADLEERGIGERIGSRLGESTMDLLDDGIDYAEENKGKVATGIAAIVLWFARGPIL